jgi:raffinose/stachyose/melibiose transport system substrate-binding protein
VSIRFAAGGKTIFRAIARFGGWFIFILTITASLYQVLTVHHELFDPNETILRIGHWQLELGYRSAIQDIIDDYEKLQWDKFHRRIKIIQMPVAQTIFDSWLATHLISGDAPDIFEMGYSPLVTQQRYIGRYLSPLTHEVETPNPYNAGTSLADVPWQQTLIDGMHSGYWPDLQDFYGIPTSMINNRMFFNRDLLKEATGSDQPPDTFGKLLAACQEIRQLGERKGTPITPIAGSSYNEGIFLTRYAVAFTSSYEPVLDVTLDGGITARQTYMGFCRGKVGFDDPRVRAFYQCMKTLCDQFGVGFYSEDRQTAAFKFVEGRAAMLATGPWDTETLFRQTQGKFRLGIMGFPLPAPGEKWGQYIAGDVNEANKAGACVYGVNKQSPNHDLAIDFLRFMTSQSHNADLNEKAQWLPITIGAKPSPLMQAFMPNSQGYSSFVTFPYGSYGTTVYDGQLQRYLQGEITYEQFSADVADALKNPDAGGDHAWAQEYDDAKRNCRSLERILQTRAVFMLMDPTSAEDARKFRRSLSQQIGFNNGELYRYQYQQLFGKPIPPP